MLALASLALPITGAIYGVISGALWFCEGMTTLSYLKSNFFADMAYVFGQGSKPIDFSIDATGYAMVSQGGEMAGINAMAPVLQGGQLQATSDPAQFFSLTVETNVKQVNLFYDASGALSGLKSAELSVNLGIHTDAQIAWSGSTIVSNIQLANENGATNTVTAHGGPTQSTLIAWVSTPSGNRIGTASVKVVSVKLGPFGNPVTTKATFVGSLPEKYSKGIQLQSNHFLAVLGSYEDYYLVYTVPYLAFIPKDNVMMFWPIEGHYISSNSTSQMAWGFRIHPIQGDKSWHRGVDIRKHKNDDPNDLNISSGLPVRAVAAGYVRRHFDGLTTGRGYYIIVEHDIPGKGKFCSSYAHLQSSGLIADGTFVKAGEQIGLVGSTGNSSGPHLHFDFWRGTQYESKDALINPTNLYANNDKRSSLYIPEPLFELFPTGTYAFNTNFDWNYGANYNWVRNPSDPNEYVKGKYSHDTSYQY